MLPNENSIDEGQPIELYKFDGTHRSYYFTSDAVSHFVNGNIYVPVPGLSRSSIKIGTQDDDSYDLTITMPIEQQMVKDYAFQSTPPNLRCTILRKDRSSATVVTGWKGEVTLISVDAGVAKFECPAMFGVALTAEVPNRAVQPMCNHVLFDSRCRVDRNAHKVSTVVTEIPSSSVGQRLIRVASRGSFPANHFRNGEMLIPSTGERHSIVNESSGNLMILNYEFSKIAVGTPVEIFAGCDHGWISEHGCPKFSNQVNYGAFPFVRGEMSNVFVSGVTWRG